MTKASAGRFEYNKKINTCLNRITVTVSYPMQWLILARPFKNIDCLDRCKRGFQRFSTFPSSIDLLCKKLKRFPLNL